MSDAILRAARRRLPWVVALAVLLGLGARPAAAHPLDIGYLRIATEGAAVDLELDLDLRGAAALLGLAEESLVPAAVPAHAGALAAASYALAPITTAAGPCRFLAPVATVVERTVRLTARATCPAAEGPRTWSLPVVRSARVAPTFELLVKERVGGEERLTVVDRGDIDIELSAGGSLGFVAFVWSGVTHIGAAPAEWHDDGGLKLPDGIDHLLFLLGLLLAGGTLARLAAVASGFTLGHSITLALAVTGLVQPPAWLIEPLIALSIALVALEALSPRLERYRFWVATGFGLVHGFGFARALVELQLSTKGLVSALFGYNLGVEIGQLAVVLLLAPAILLIHRHARVRRVAVPVIAAAVTAAGLYWFVERVAGRLAG